MKYKDYNINDFLTDEFFIQWVKKPDENNLHFWEKWLDQHPEKREVVMQAIIFIRSVHYESKSLMDDRRYVETFENILKADKEHCLEEALPRNPRSLNMNFPWRGIAASLLVFFCLTIAYQLLIHPVEIEKTIRKEMTMVKKFNPAGKKSIITLSDGTRIFLNSESEITYASEFNDSIRWVSLTGEAFFEVRKEGRPFVVETGKTKIRVLGTSFNVNHSGNGALTVALVTGKVRINDFNGNQMQLEPSEMMVREKDGALHKTNFDILEVTGWKEKILVFKKNSFVEVKQKIENWFGVKVEVQGKINLDWTYSGTYEDETLENVLRGIFFTSGLAYEIEDKEVTLLNANYIEHSKAE